MNISNQEHMNANNSSVNHSYIAFRLLSSVIFIILLSVLWARSLWAQSPEKMSYQTIIRDGDKMIVANSTAGIQVSLLQGSESGTAVFVETHTPISNENGLITIEIGEGTVVSGDFTAIDWSNGPYYLKIETDPNGGTDYTITGTSQMLSIPYVLHSKTAEFITETDPVFGASAASGITEEDTTDWNDKLDTEVDGSPTNEIQIISRTGLIVSLTDGGTYTDSINVFLGDMQNRNLTNLADPVYSQDIATKAYVDALEAQIVTMENILQLNDTNTVEDIENNVYSAVVICNQYWMAENLRTATYNDGTPIPEVTDNTEWANLSTGAYCWYNNDSVITDWVYGKLYNWHAVNTGILCPVGWHVPSDEEWKELEMFLGMSQAEADDISYNFWRGTDEGAKLKESGTRHWSHLNTVATNSSGFTGLPGGYREMSGNFYSFGVGAYFWTSTVGGSIYVYYRTLSSNMSKVYRDSDYKNHGYSVRCIRDE